MGEPPDLHGKTLSFTLGEPTGLHGKVPALTVGGPPDLCGKNPIMAVGEPPDLLGKTLALTVGEPPDFCGKIPALAMGEPSDLYEKTLDFTMGRLPRLAVISPQTQRPRAVAFTPALPPRGRVCLHTYNHSALFGGRTAREVALDAAGRAPGSSALGRQCPAPCASRGLLQDRSLWS